MLANVIFLWKLVPNGIHREASADGLLRKGWLDRVSLDLV